MGEKPAFFMAFSNAPANGEVEWNEWLNKTHMPARLALPGFLSAHRFIAIEGDRKYFHSFALTDDGVLNSESYLKLREKELSQGDPSSKFMAMSAAIPGTYRGIYEQIYPVGKAFLEPRSDVMLVVGLDVPQDKDEELNAWYNTEHIPARLRVPGFLSAYRFVARGEEISAGRKASGPKYIALWEVESEKVFQTDEYQEARNSPWTSSMSKWYTRRFRTIYRHIY